MEKLTVSDLVVCYKDETLHDIIVRKHEWDVMDIPVLDREGRVIADLDVLCLLELWLKKGNKAFSWLPIRYWRSVSCSFLVIGAAGRPTLCNYQGSVVTWLPGCCSAPQYHIFSPAS